MDIHEAIQRRRATRRYTDRVVPKAAVMDIIRAATQAPSALNQQPWAFGVFHGRALLEDFSRRAKAHLVATLVPSFDPNPRSQVYTEKDYSIVHHAGTLVILFARLGPASTTEECGLAAQNLMLAAHGLGLATCPIGFMRPWLNLPEIKVELGVPEECTAVFPIVVGYAAETPPDVPRREPEFVAWKWVEESSGSRPPYESLGPANDDARRSVATIGAIHAGVGG